jgi:hypothetical protein
LHVGPVDEGVDGCPADPVASFVHQGAQLLVARLPRRDLLCNVLATEELEFLRSRDRVDIERRRCAARKRRRDQPYRTKLDPHRFPFLVARRQAIPIARATLNIHLRPNSCEIMPT